MPDDKPMTAREVAELYGVNIVTVHRWVKRKLFDEGVVTVFGSPGGIRDRVLFDRQLVTEQHKRETSS